MNVLVIPARWGSTRFPGKPLAEIAGEPMVVRVWKRVRQVAGFDQVLVATDDERVADCLYANDVDFLITGTECRNGTERCAWVAESNELPDSDLIVNVQGDEPLMEPAIVQRVLFNLQHRPERVWTVVRKVREGELENRDCVKSRVENGKIVEYGRLPYRVEPTAMSMFGGHYKKQEFNYVHVGVYGYSVKKLREYASMEPTVDELKWGLEQLRWREPLACVTVEYDGIGVDRPEDIKRVEDRLNGPATV